MSARVAFKPLETLETALDSAVQQRARALFETAIARTAKGSGHDLDKSISGNNTAIASACLLLAKTEEEGAVTEDLEIHQRRSMFTKPQFKLLVSTLQTVLDLRSNAKTAFTPTRGSARKRKSEAQELHEEPTTPSKSARISQASKLTSPAKDKAATPTRTPGRRSGRTTAALRELATASHERSKRAAEAEVAADEDSVRLGRSSPRKQDAASWTSVNVQPARTPTKSSVKGKERATDAFDKAMDQETPTKQKSALKTVASKPAIDYSIPFVAADDNAEVANKQESEAIPYETYWGDMLIRYRHKDTVKARKQKTDAWRQDMLNKLNVVL